MCISGLALAAEDVIAPSIKEADVLRSSDPKAFLALLEQINEQKKSLNAPSKLWLRYLNAYRQSFEGEFENALNTYSELLSETNDKALKTRLRISLGNIYYIQREHGKGIENLKLLASELLDVKDKQTKHLGNIVVAMNYNGYRRYDLARNYAEQIIQDSPQERNLCFAKQIKYEAEYHLKTLSVTSDEFLAAIEHCQSINESIASMLLRVLVARTYLDSNQSVEALNYLAPFREEVEALGYTALTADYYVLLARARWEAKNDKSSIELAKLALDNSKNEVYIQPKVMAYALMHEIEKNRGNFKMALAHYEKYSEADKAQINEVLAQQLAYNIVEHQTEEKIQEIKFLNQKNEVLQLEQDLAKKEAANNRLMALLLFFFLASLAFWAYRVKRNQMKLKRQSETDLLTGVSSRHHFYFVCRKTLDYAKSNDQEVSFVLFDMDKFKSVNDNYGHLVGDWVLKKAIEVTRPCWRQNDIAGRLGGEEFALMLPTCDMEKAFEIAENCRKAIEAVDTSESGHKFKITASFGITSSKTSGFELSKLIGDSDKVMYQAKAAGKNRVLRVDSAEQ